MAVKAGAYGQGTLGSRDARAAGGAVSGYNRLCESCARACKQQARCVVVSCPLRVAGSSAT